MKFLFLINKELLAHKLNNPFKDAPSRQETLDRWEYQNGIFSYIRYENRSFRLLLSYVPSCFALNPK
jgi:hypothetical protein